jgi:hypothetical protein
MMREQSFVDTRYKNGKQSCVSRHMVAATVMVPVAAARLVVVDLYVSGRMLGLKENLNSMSSSSPFIVVSLVLLNDAHRMERK